MQSLQEELQSRWKFVQSQIIHSGEKPYECEICKKSFIESESLIHSCKKPKQCKVCKKRFNVCGHLNSYQRILSCEKPYDCNIFKKSCRNTYCTLEHMQNDSFWRKKTYKCEVCIKSFTKSGSLITHKKDSFWGFFVFGP